MNRASRYAAWCTFALAPLPFGSVEPLYVQGWCLLLGLSLVTAPAPTLTPRRVARLAPVALGFATLGAVVILQSLAPGLVAPASAAWARVGALLGTAVEPAVTATHDPPWRALGPSLLFVMAFARAYLLALDPAEARRLLKLVAWAGVAYALFGMASLLVEPGMLLWREKRAYLGSLTGPFVNRNTAATYFGTCAIAWFVLLLRAVRRRADPGSTWRETLATLVQEQPRDVAVPALGFGATLLAVLATGSRAGSLLTLVCLAGATHLWARGRTRGTRPLVVALGVVGGTVLALVLLGSTLTGRIATRGLSDPGRWEIYGGTLAMIADAPWLGAGLGGYGFAFPPFRMDGSSSVGVIDKAHSVPLELAAEIGVPAAVVIVLCALMVLRQIARGVIRRQRDRAVPTVGAAAAVLAGAHSCVDFSLQVPGYAVTCAVIVAAALAQSTTSPPQSHEGALTSQAN